MERKEEQEDEQRKEKGQEELERKIYIKYPLYIYLFILFLSFLFFFLCSFVPQHYCLRERKEDEFGHKVMDRKGNGRKGDWWVDSKGTGIGWEGKSVQMKVSKEPSVVEREVGKKDGWTI